MLPTLIVVVLIAGLIVLFLSLSGKEKSGWVQFYAKGKDSGFSFREIELLRQLAVKCKLEEPASLFWSQAQLDTCIRSLVRSLHVSGGGDQAANDFLSKLYDFRKKVEMEKPKVKHGISNSRQISAGQNLRVLVAGSGVFKSQVVKNSSQYLIISRPTNSKITSSFSWQGLKISVYFWRDDDAGYVFDSCVADEVFSKGISSLKIDQADKLFRTQKRKSIRVKLHKAAYLYLLASDEDINKIETEPGQKCFLEDLSDTGCAVTIGGKGTADMRVKVQFALGGAPISMSGTVRSVQYKEDLDRTTLRIEADPMPIDIRNKILGEVFGMLPDDEEDLPFRILNEEAEEFAAESSAALEPLESLPLLEDRDDGDDSNSMGTAL